MISILIPIYNCKVTKLVDTLAEQCEKAKIDFEIICMDEHSKNKWRKENDSIRHKFKVNYIELSENIGRAKIRNWLAKLARFEWLLYLDCDSSIHSKKFIKNYLEHTTVNQVIYGGRFYHDSKPRTPKKMLHWKYGSKIESRNAQKRNKKPYLNFMSNNFLVDIQTFNKIKFDESINGYGYEDLVFAKSLMDGGHKIVHVDNPVRHDGIEYNEDYLKKTEVALKNLNDLYTDQKIMKTRLLGAVENLQSYGALNIVHGVLKKRRKQLEKNLLSTNPSMKRFAMWKLLTLLEMTKK